MSRSASSLPARRFVGRRFGAERRSAQRTEMLPSSASQTCRPTQVDLSIANETMMLRWSGSRSKLPRCVTLICSNGVFRSGGSWIDMRQINAPDQTIKGTTSIGSCDGETQYARYKTWTGNLSFTGIQPESRLLSHCSSTTGWCGTPPRPPRR